MEEPLAYVVAHLHEALIKDGRFTEQAIEIDALEDRIVLRGEVATLDRRAGIVQLVSQMMPEFTVVDDLCVSCTDVRQEAEKL